MLCFDRDFVNIWHIFCHVGEYLLLRKACAACNVYGTCSLAGAGYRIHETSDNNP
jgi:hypothetical protein